MAENVVTMTMAQMITLTVEHWRLSAAMKESAAGGPAARHALRKMEDVLKGVGMEARSLDGTAYDAGLSVQVVDRLSASFIRKGIEVISETISPLVLFEGNVVKAAEVVVTVGEGVT